MPDERGKSLRCRFNVLDVCLYRPFILIQSQGLQRRVPLQDGSDMSRPPPPPPRFGSLFTPFVSYLGGVQYQEGWSSCCCELGFYES